MTEKEMTDELGEVLCSAIAETHAGKAEFEMGVEESDGDSGMSFRSDEGAEDLGEVAAVMGTVLVLGGVVGERSSAEVEHVVGIQDSEEEEDSGDGEDEAEESDDDADDEGTASLPVRTRSVVTPPQRGRLTAPCLKPGLRSTAEGKRYRVDVSNQRSCGSTVVPQTPLQRAPLQLDGVCPTASLSLSTLDLSTIET